MIGVAGFEPTTSSSRTKRASQAALHPEIQLGNRLLQGINLSYIFLNYCI